MTQRHQFVITGAAGFVGRNLVRFFSDAGHKVVGVDLPSDQRDLRIIHADIRDGGAIVAAIRSAEPSVVIHVAGNKNVQHCQKHPDDAYATNALGTQNVARACRTVGAQLIYLSTDLVFAADRGQYAEDETPRPASVYGQTKLDGERLALEELPDCIICRSGGIYGRHSPLLLWLQGELRAGRRVPCFTDVYNTPTFADNLGEMMQSVLGRKLRGIFHTVGRERVNRFEFFRSFAEVFELPAELLDPVVGGAQRDQMLLRPDSSLSSHKTAASLGINFNSVAEGFGRLKQSGGLA